jgi:NAD(P)-dependent dehydrogenase (short-subunit alcohol dehydrogenase family)
MLTGINRGRRPRSVERGVFGRSAGPDEGVFAGGLGLGERGVDRSGEARIAPVSTRPSLSPASWSAKPERSKPSNRRRRWRRSGHILLVASLLAFQAVPSYAAYAATKAYVLALGEALHDEFRAHGVVVTSLCPGHTATGFDAAAGASISPLLRVLTMKPGPVARSGIRALLHGKAMVVAGLPNKMAAFSNRLTPRAMQRGTMKRIMGP